MSRITFASLLLALSLSSAAAAIDFTPVVKDYTGEGILYRRVILKDGEGSIVFNPPQGWTVGGGKEAVQLSCPGKNFVDAVIHSKAPLSGARGFDEAAVNALQQQVVAEVPPDSQAVEVIRRQENPILMDQNPSFEFVLTYQTLGYTFQRTVIYVQTPETQLVFQFSAPKADFEALNQAFRRSIASWKWILPENEERAVASSTAPQAGAGRSN